MERHARAHPAPSRPARSFGASETPRADGLITPICRWIVFLAGVTLFIAVALVPPSADLERIRQTRDQTLALEQHHLRRLSNYQAMADALAARRPETLRLVLASELQLVPAGSTALVLPGTPDDPRLFERLEPTPSPTLAPPAPPTPSALTKLATDQIGRLALLILAAAAVLWGCLPPPTSSR